MFALDTLRIVLFGALAAIFVALAIGQFVNGEYDKGYIRLNTGALFAILYQLSQWSITCN